MTIASLGLAVDSTPAQRAAVDLDKLAASSAVAEQAVNKLGTTAPVALAKVAAGAGPISQKLREAANDAESFAARINRALNVRSDFAGMGRSADIEAYGRQLDALRAKFDPLFAAQQQYKTKIDEITQAERLGAITATLAIQARVQETASFNGLVSALNNAANARKAYAQATVDKITVTPDRGADIAAYGTELDRLRAKFNPLFATIQQYKATQVEIRQAHSIGAISVNEMTAALDRERSAALANIAALRGRRDVVPSQNSLRPSSFNTANIAAQFQDIGVTAAMGMSPLQIALQQGTQLSAVFNDIKAKGQSIGPALVTSFSSIISPVSLITIGLIAAGVAAGQFLYSFLQGSAKTAEALEKEAALVQSVANKWTEALPALTAYANERQRIADQKDISDATNAAVEDRYSGVRKQINGLAVALEDAQSQLRSFGQSSTEIQTVRDEFSTLEKAIKNNKGTTEEAIRIGIALSSHFNQTQIPALDDLAKRFFALAGAISVANSEATKLTAESLLRDASKNVLPALGTIPPVLSGGGNFIDEAELQRRRAEETKSQYQTEQERLEKLRSRKTPGQREAERDANAYRDLIKSVDDRIGQMQLEAQLVGKTGVEADAYRVKLELLQKAEDKGRHASPAQVAEIESKVAAYQKLAEAAAKAKLQADLQFERDQMGRSEIDQNVAATLKNAGLAVDLNSADAAAIRFNERMKEARSLAGDFASTFINGLEQGKSVFESLGDAALSVLDRITDKLLNEVLNALFEVNNAGSGGGGIFGSILGALGLGGGGISSPLVKSAIGAGTGGLFADGGAFSGGVQAFAKGGTFSNSIVSSPTLFKFANGTGLMGEAGPEAIMPLKRDSSGRLGVSAGGRAAANNNQPGKVEVTMKVDLTGAKGDREIEAIVRNAADEAVSRGISEYDAAKQNRYANGGGSY
jgi:lambda family phage tail tape measure protein